jgi:hypothetical protein
VYDARDVEVIGPERLAAYSGSTIGLVASR